MKSALKKVISLFCFSYRGLSKLNPARRFFFNVLFLILSTLSTGLGQGVCDSINIERAYQYSVDLQYRWKRDSSILVARNAINCSVAAKNKYGEARMLQRLGAIHSVMSLSDTAKVYLNRSLALAKDNGFGNIEVDVLNSLGDIYIRNINSSHFFGRENQYSKSLEFFMNAEFLAERRGYKHGEAYANLKIGYVYFEMGNFPLSRTYYSKALALSESTISNYAFRWMGTSCRDEGKYDSAVYWYKRGIVAAEMKSDCIGSIKGLHFLGDALLALGLPDSAYFYINKSLRKSWECNFMSEVSWSHKRIGDSYLKMKKYKLANLYYDSAIAERDNDEIGLSMMKLAYGKSLILEGHMQEAEFQLKDALRFGKKAGDYMRYRDALYALIDYYRMRGKYRVALEYQSRQIAFLDSLNKAGFVDLAVSLTQSARDKQLWTLKEQNDKTMRELQEQRILKGILVFSILVALIIISMVYLALRIKRNSNKALEVQNVIISAQKEELRASLDNLKEINAKLFQSEKMASLGLLTAGVAHEINNPLNFISGGVQALDTTVRDMISRLKQQSNPDNGDVARIQTEAEELLATVNTGIDRASKIVNSLRVFSRTEESKMERVSVKECMDLAITIMGFKIKSSKVKVTWKIEDTFFVLGNASQLVQVFTNLLDNALQATECVSGEKIVTVKVVDEGDWKVLLFYDNGEGIPESVRNKIFDPFFTTKEAGKGTGLGLSISHSIIEKHEGKMDFESELGKGTVFKVYLRPYLLSV